MTRETLPFPDLVPLPPGLDDPADFSQRVLGRPLRPYQIEPLRAIVRSVRQRAGRVFTVMFARQMGKNELSAHLEAYLLTICSQAGGSIVKAAPTFKPQATLSKGRLEATLARSTLRQNWRSEGGDAIHVGRARIQFFSGEPAANVVGATASRLLEIDEAQDFDAEKYQRDFRPMAATTNATTVLYGTAWAEDDLLAQQSRAGAPAEAADGLRRHFKYDWTALAAISPAYRQFVEGERARLGDEHPLFLTQYALQPLPGAGRLLSPAHLAQLAGEHPRVADPAALDAPVVAGLDLAGAGADETVLTLATLDEQLCAGVAQPLLRIVALARWRGVPLDDLYAQLADLLGRVWRVRRLAADATGLGAGVVAFLGAALGAEVVTPVVFSGPVKSRLGYALLAAIGAGRLRMYAADGAAETDDFWAQMRACRREIGPAQALRFAAPAGAHDDFVVSAALCTHAAGATGPAPAAEYVEADDVLAGS